MAQISIFDKTRHFSDKDFTCSIGKNEMVYFTFRNNSWKRFTESDNIAVYVKSSKKGNYFRFGDPEKGAPGAVFKLGYKKDKKASRESTRYLQISGKIYPEILEIVRNKSGSYDFPDSVHVAKPKRQRKPKTEAAKKLSEELKAYKPEIRTMENSNSQILPDFSELRYFLVGAKSNEERIEIWKTFAAIYGGNVEPNPAPSHCKPSEVSEKAAPNWIDEALQ